MCHRCSSPPSKQRKGKEMEKRTYSYCKTIFHLEHNISKNEEPTGCPAQAKAMPPHVADTMTTTRSDTSANSVLNMLDKAQVICA